MKGWARSGAAKEWPRWRWRAWSRANERLAHCHPERTSNVDSRQTKSLPDALAEITHGASFLQYLLARARGIPSARSGGSRGEDVHLRADGLQPRAHRKFSRLYFRRSAPAASRNARLHGRARDEPDRRRRQDDPRQSRGESAAARIHRAIQGSVFPGPGHAADQARATFPGRDRRALHRRR